MEIEDQGGAKIELSNKAVLGRGSGVSSGDRTVSRRHVAFEVESGTNQTEPRVSFEVLGKNPVWVRRSEGDELRVFRCSEKGRLSEGDWFCLSGNEPNWFALRKIGADDWETRVLDDEDETELGSKFEAFDVSNIDPVKEFGFVVMGHEFDVYPRHMIRDPKRWDWFLEGDRKESSDDDDDEDGEFGKRKKKGSMRRKRKKGEENEDEDWSGGESEDDKEVVCSVRKGVRPTYSTRSKDRDLYDSQGSKKPRQKKIYSSNREDDDDDDDEDETLGGFIVGDNEMNQEEEIIGDNEEEEFVEDDNDEDD